MTADRKPPEHIAIIGCGFTGTSALFQLIDRYADQFRKVTVFEASGRFGPGYPYREDDAPAYLVNNTNATLCLVPSNRRAFLDWARMQPQWTDAADPDGHLPRAAYGAFLTDAARAARTMAAIKGISVEMIPEEATRLTEQEGGGVLVRSASQEVTADVAILATGRAPDINPYPSPPKRSHARYVASHVMDAQLDDVASDATVHVLGASLSAYDVVNRLFAPDTGCRFERAGDDGLRFVSGPNMRRVVLCSRSGRPKAVQSRHPMHLQRHHFTPNALRNRAGPYGFSLRDVAEAIRVEAEAHGVPLDPQSLADPYAGARTAEAVNARGGELIAQALAAATDPARRNFFVDFFSDAQDDIWDLFAEGLLRPEAEREYRARYESAVLSYAAPCPVPTAERLLALHRAGRLVIRKGAGTVRFDSSADRYEIDHAFGTERATILVDTTGALDRDVGSPGQPPLVAGLFADGVLTPHDRGDGPMPGASVDMTTFRLRGARDVYAANMMLWGPGFFTSSAYTMASVVERLLAGMFGRGGDDAIRRKLASVQ